MEKRVKETPVETDDLARWTRRSKTGTTTIWTYQGTSSARRNTESKMVGQDIPNFHEKKRRGDLLPHTAFFQYEAYTESDTYNYSATSSSGYNYVNVIANNSSSACSEFGGIVLGELSGVGFVEDVDAGAYLRDALAAINNKGHDSLTFLAELHQVRRMFRKVCQNLLRLIRNPRDLDHIANLWLEGRYGWRTLRYDIQDLNHAFAEFDVKRTRYTESRGTTYSKQIIELEHASMSAGTYDINHEYQLEIGVRGVVTADISPARFRANIAVTAWELVPFSFVVDWLYDIGNALESMVFLTSVKQYSASYGTKVSCTYTLSTSNLNRDSGFTAWSFNRTHVEKGTWTYRTPTGVSITPSTQLKLDGFKVLDILALVRQQLSRTRKRA